MRVKLRCLGPGDLAAAWVTLLFAVGAVADRWGLGAVFYLLAASMLVANVLVYFLPHHDPRKGAGA